MINLFDKITPYSGDMFCPSHLYGLKCSDFINVYERFDHPVTERTAVINNYVRGVRALLADEHKDNLEVISDIAAKLIAADTMSNLDNPRLHVSYFPALDDKEVRLMCKAVIDRFHGESADLSWSPTCAEYGRLHAREAEEKEAA